MPEIMYDTQEAVPEAFRSDAVAKDGKWAIDVSPTKKLNEFRDNNINVSKERDTVKGLLGRLQTDVGLDPEKIDDFVTDYASLKTMREQVEAGKLVADTSLEEAIQTRTKKMVSDHETQTKAMAERNKALEQENAGLKTQVNNGIIDREMLAAIGNETSGALPSATKHILNEAYRYFKVNEHGRIVPHDAEGKVMYGSDGTKPMSAIEWLTGTFKEENPFFFKGSSGGGAGGGADSPGGLSDAEIMKMSPGERMAYGRKHNRG